jgi:hypothetical protein
MNLGCEETLERQTLAVMALATLYTNKPTISAFPYINKSPDR